MFKRILAAALIAATLATLAVAPSSGDSEKRLSVDSASPVELIGGKVAVTPGTNASELLSCFNDRANVTLTDADGAPLSATDKVGSGATLTCGDDSAAAIVPGDVTGDAKIGVRDVVCAMRFLVGAEGRFFADAIDVDGDGEKNAADVTKLMKYLVGWNESLGAPHESAENDDPALGMYFDSILHRVGRSDTTVYGSADGIFRAAKNEVEDAQIILTSAEAKEDLTLDVGALANSDGDVLDVQLHFGYYYEMAMFNDLKTRDFGNYKDDGWVDPYPLLHGQSFGIGANESKSFMAQITVPADAKSGWYRASVTVRDGAGNEIKKASLRMYVWDFALDEETACDTLFLTWSYGAAGYYSAKYPEGHYGDGAVWTPIYKENFYDYMLKYRISGYELPYDILDSRVDEYLDDPRVTSFISVGGMTAVDLTAESTKARVRAVYDKLETNPVWAEKAYVYTVDEPYYEEGAELVRAQWTNAKSILGDTPFKTVLPFGNNYLSNDGVDQLEYLWDYCNAFCPSEGVFTPCEMPNVRSKDRDKFPEWGEYMASGQFKKYGDFLPRYEKLRERGDSMWWYVCCSPQYPYANFFNYYQGDWTRIVLWIQYLVHSDGLLYWSTNSWTLGEHDSRKITLTRTNTGGDGLLIYDGMLWGEPGPTAVPTSRLEAIRDGIEDFQYMKQLERALGENGRDEVLENFVTRLVTDVTHFSQDYLFMESVRSEMGFMLEGLAR